MKSKVKLNTYVGIVSVSIALAISIEASASITDQTSATPYTYSHLSFADQYAQANSVSDLRPSTVRRLQFYSDKVISALMVLVNEDNQAAQNGSTVNSTTTAVLRSAIERLIGAGEKSDLTLKQTSDFFTQEAAAVFQSDYPTILMDADGKLDAYVLFQGVALSASSASNTDVAAAADYLKMVTSAGVDAQSDPTSATPTITPTTVVEVQVVEPEITRPPAVQVYWDRLTVSNGVSSITVRQGDTLATYAAVFYQDALLYRQIFTANSNLLRSPSFLEVGQVIVIPDI